MVKRYKVLKDCLDAKGLKIMAGRIYTFNQPIREYNISEGLLTEITLSKAALENTDFFQEVEPTEEKAKISLELTYPNKDGWNEFMRGKINQGDQLTFSNELSALFKRYTGSKVARQPLMDTNIYSPPLRDPKTYLVNGKSKTHPCPLVGEYWICKPLTEALLITNLFHDVTCSYVQSNGNKGMLLIDHLDRLATDEEIKAYKKDKPGLFKFWQ